jgi:2'-5' RNA ligase
LAHVCETVCQPLGYPGESRGFHPHVTLARIDGRPPEELSALLEEYADTSFGPLPIHAIELLQSNLGRGSPQYATLATMALRVDPSNAADAE